uniref:Uncharacterized protein n=1 Tax=Arundo donax TaxID=35708 RepID=A0A0A8ZJC9_ARUDO
MLILRCVCKILLICLYDAFG